jgi:hypothetical protein
MNIPQTNAKKNVPTQTPTTIAATSPPVSPALFKSVAAMLRIVPLTTLFAQSEIILGVSLALEYHTGVPLVKVTLTMKSVQGIKVTVSEVN